jgi:hypothetical protein
VVKNILHRTNKRIAKRALGKDGPTEERIVQRWASSPPELRPFPIFKDGNINCAWENDIANAGGIPGAANPAATDSQT